MSGDAKQRKQARDQKRLINLGQLASAQVESMRKQLDDVRASCELRVMQETSHRLQAEARAEKYRVQVDRLADQFAAMSTLIGDALDGKAPPNDGSVAAGIAARVHELYRIAHDLSMECTNLDKQVTALKQDKTDMPKLRQRLQKQHEEQAAERSAAQRTVHALRSYVKDLETALASRVGTPKPGSVQLVDARQLSPESSKQTNNQPMTVDSESA